MGDAPYRLKFVLSDPPLRKTPTSTDFRLQHITVLEHALHGLSAIAELLVSC